MDEKMEKPIKQETLEDGEAVKPRVERLNDRTYAYFGPIGRAINDVRNRDNPQEVWTGRGVTVKGKEQMVKDSGIIEAKNLDPFYVQASLDAPTRCIDGRCQACYSGQKRKLGPQVPGGTATLPVCIRLADPLSRFPDKNGRPIGGLTEGVQLPAEANQNDDLGRLVSLMRDEWGLTPGDHNDDHIYPGSGEMSMFVGCGALDRLEEILEKMRDPRAYKQLKGICKTLLGAEYDQAVFDEVVSKISGVGSYLNPDYRDESINTLGDENVEQLTGPHNEVALVVNTVEGTTLDRDNLSNHYGNKLQVFNYDAWRTKQIAEKLYKDKLSQQRLIITRAMFAVATAMVLTDGTVDLIVRQ
jgi:hypothetical protein